MTIFQFKMQAKIFRARVDIILLIKLLILCFVTVMASAVSAYADQTNNKDNKQQKIAYITEQQAKILKDKKKIKKSQALSSFFLQSQSTIPNDIIERDTFSRENSDERLSSFGPNLLGDSIDLKTGNITFENVDISIPGNASLEVSVRRIRSTDFPFKHLDSASQSTVSSFYGSPLTKSHAFSDWGLDIPNISITMPLALDEYGNAGVVPTDPAIEELCQGSFVPPIVVMAPHVDAPGGDELNLDGGDFAVFEREDTSNGLELNIPGIGKKKWLENPQGISWPSGTNLVTKDYWTLKCGQSRSGPDEAIATAPDGTQYTFGRYDIRIAKSLTASGIYANQLTPGGDPSRWGTSLPRVNMILQVTEVTDVHGNWVKYEYDPHGWPTRIHSNDGREILINYGSNGLVTSISTNGRIWTYNYATQSGKSVLDEVILPDQRKWQYDLTPYVVEANSELECEVPDVDWNIIHPSGITGVFTFSELKFSSQGSSSIERLTCTTPKQRVLEASYDTMSIVSKTLSGPDYGPASWIYDYTEFDENVVGQGAVTAVTDPSGVVTKTTYSVFSGVPMSNNLIEKVELMDANSSTLFKSVIYEYQTESPLGTTWLVNENHSDYTQPNHTIKAVTTQDGDTFTSESSFNTAQGSTGYSYGNPTQTRAYSNVSTTHRVTDTTYEHNTSSWIMGLPKTVTQNGRLLTTNHYDPVTGKLTSVRKYGASHDYASLAYNADGTIDAVTDALGRVTKAENWKRGMAQDITSAFGSVDAITEHQYVDDNGWLTSKVDGKGQTTSYTHDSMGRLTRISPPDNWADTVINYNFTGGGAVQTITKGASKTTVTYDSMLRPVLERTQATDTGWSSYVNTEYDALGRVTFKSQPSLSSVETNGMSYTYDGLGRVITEIETASGATTTHSYSSEHRHTVTDPSGAWVRYSSYGYDGPGNKDYSSIYEGSGGRNTQIFKNIWGEVGQIRQKSGGPNAVDNKVVRQHFFYDDQYRLCRHQTSEGGSTIYDYDNAGQMIAYAKGQPNSGCTVPSSNARVDLVYDDLGRLKDTLFADSNTPDIFRDYDDNSNLTEIYRGTGATAVNWDYAYNSLNLPTHETLTLDGLTFPITHTYNINGHQLWKNHPGNINIKFVPDGLGRATKAKHSTIKTYADNITYHPNGAVNNITYGNGQVFTQTLNNRLLPYQLQASGNGATPLDLTYSYDLRAKVTSILDGAQSGNNRSYSYDALGQMKTATGPWGTQVNDYDTFGNINSRVFSGGSPRTIDLQYDNKNRVYQSIDSASAGTGFGDSGTGIRTVGYDARGNVTTLGSMSFVYDMSDQPTVLNGSLAGTSFNSSSFTYDGHLKRVKSVINGRTIYNVYDSSGALIHVRKEAFGGDPLERSDYIRAGGKAIARAIRNGETYYTFSDHLGSPVATMVDSTGAIERERYTPFGIAMDNPNALTDQAGFTGHIKDSATGLNYMQARYYDPVMGRFLSIDPVTFMSTGNPIHFNRYAYGNNDPINMIDPDGRQSIPSGGLHQSGSQIAYETALVAFEPIYDFVAADAVNAVKSILNGEFRAAGVSLAMAAIKPVKIADKANDVIKKGEGIVYKRTNPKTGACYIGQCKNLKRFEKRQKEHDKQLGETHEYEPLETNVDADDLDYIEDSYIREEGLENLENKRHQMTEARRAEYENR